VGCALGLGEVVFVLGFVLDERFAVAAGAAAAEFGIERLQLARTELADGDSTESGLDDARDVAGVAVACAVLQVGVAEPLVDRIREFHRGCRAPLLEDLGEELGAFVPACFQAASSVPLTVTRL
jgi:hypothetical protein